MPVGLVQTPATTFIGPGEADEIRLCLALIDEAERPLLYSALDAIGAIDGPNGALVAGIIARLPAGPIARCIHNIAHRRGLRSTVAPSPPTLAALRHRRRQRPYRTLRGMVAPVGTWAQRGWWRWHAWDTDAFADLRRYRHKPVLLQWQHRSGVPLGISQSWDVDDTGNLWGTFMLGATPPAQAAAELATDGVLGLSLGATATTDWLAVVGVDEWDPYAAAVDVGLRRRPHLLEVSLTKNPVFDDCKVAFVD